MQNHEYVLTGLKQMIELIDRGWSYLSIRSFGLWNNRGWDGPGNDFEINFYASGNNRIRQDGDELAVTEGQVLFLPDTIRNSYCEDGIFKVYYTSFSFDEHIHLRENLREIYTVLSPLTRPLHMPGLEQHFSILLAELRTGGRSPYLIKHYFMHLLVKMYESFLVYGGQKAAQSRLNHEQRVDQIIHFLNENYRSKFRLADLARKYAMNERYLNQVFKNMTGITLGRYVTRIRLEHAKRLLLTTHQTMTEIALDSGFFDAAHFCKTFKAHENITPQQYKIKYGTR